SDGIACVVETGVAAHRHRECSRIGIVVRNELDSVATASPGDVPHQRARPGAPQLDAVRRTASHLVVVDGDPGVGGTDPDPATRDHVVVDVHRAVISVHVDTQGSVLDRAVLDLGQHRTADPDRGVIHGAGEGAALDLHAPAVAAADQADGAAVEPAPMSLEVHVA